MADVTLSSIKSPQVPFADIQSRNLQSGVVATSSSFFGTSAVDAQFLQSAGNVLADTLTEVLSISGASGWLLYCLVRNSFNAANTPASNIVRGVLTIDGIVVADASMPSSSILDDAGVLLLGTPLLGASIGEPLPVRFNDGFSLQVASDIDRTSNPRIGYLIRYFLD